jgi:alkylhydroperoxidase/carboxymuconolactone decarboxylase family protein YurZ
MEISFQGRFVMPGKKEKSMENVREYCTSYFGRVLDHHELMGRYYPECLEKWMEARQSLFKDPPEGALTLREKELIAIAIEIAVRKPNVSFHVKKAIDAGATAKEIAELAGICMLLAGMITLVESGQHALRVAEEYEKELAARKKPR